MYTKRNCSIEIEESLVILTSSMNKKHTNCELYYTLHRPKLASIYWLNYLANINIKCRLPYMKQNMEMEDF